MQILIVCCILTWKSVFLFLFYSHDSRRLCCSMWRMYPSFYKLFGTYRNFSHFNQIPLTFPQAHAPNFTGITEPTLQMICYVNYLPDYGWWGVYDLITMHAPIFAMYMWPMKAKEIELKTLNLLISCFLFILSSKMLGTTFDWPLKLLKVSLTHSMPPAP